MNDKVCDVTTEMMYGLNNEYIFFSSVNSLNRARKMFKPVTISNMAYATSALTVTAIVSALEVFGLLINIAELNEDSILF